MIGLDFVFDCMLAFAIGYAVGTVICVVMSNLGG